MSEIITNIAKDCLNITLKESNAANAAFVEIIAPSLGEYRKILKQNPLLTKGQVFTFGEHIPLNIKSGMESLLCDEENALKLEDEFHFEFFVYFFTNTWLNSNLPEQKSLEGRLKAGLNDSKKLRALYFELMVGYVYLYRKNRVIFNDLRDSTAKNFDYLISKSGVEYCVEAKTIDNFTGLPIKSEWAKEAIGIISAFIDKWPSRWPSYKAKITYHGSRNPSHRDIFEDINYLIGQLANSDEATGKLFKVIIFPHPVFNLDEYLEKHLASSNHDYIFSSLSSRAIGSGITEFSILEGWNLEQKIADVIKYVYKNQLPNNTKNIIWIQLLNTTQIVANPEFLKNFITNSGKIMWELKKRLNHSKTLVGCHFASDPHTFSALPETLSITFVNQFLSMLNRPEDISVYSNLIFQGKLDATSTSFFQLI